MEDINRDSSRLKEIESIGMNETVDNITIKFIFHFQVPQFLIFSLILKFNFSV